jgi:hypothetical protein
MSGESNRTQVSREQEASVHRKRAEFQEAPGEAQAEAVRDAFLHGAGADTAGVSAALAGADPGVRAQALNRLQQRQGNAFVQRVVAEAQGTPGRLVGRSQAEMVQEVQQRKDAGSPLPGDTREQMEGYFGADLSGVRVHDGAAAASLNRELGAQAFTVGKDVYFGEGKYEPGSTQGQATIAHELTHVGQQTGFTPATASVQRQGGEEEEQVQELALQRQGEEDEEQVQALAVQREGEEDEEPAGS